MTWQEWHEYANDEENWKGHDERGLLKAEHVDEFLLRLWFEDELNVSIYELDFSSLFVDNNPGGVYAPLKNARRFQAVEGDYSLNWLNPETGEYDDSSIDISPECIRFFCERYGRKLNANGKASDKVAIAA